MLTTGIDWGIVLAPIKKPVLMILIRQNIIKSAISGNQLNICTAFELHHSIIFNYQDIMVA
jgi:hypothetical protein